MKIVNQSENHLNLKDENAGRYSRAVLVLIPIFIIAVFYLRINGDVAITTLQIAVIIILGLLALPLCIRILFWESPVSTIASDRSSRRISILPSNLFHKKDFSYSFSEIEKFYIVDVGTEFDGWQIEFLLANGKSIALAPSTTYTKKLEAEEIQRLIESYLV